MIPITQTIISNDEGTIHGNCFPASIASILEVPIEEIPPLQNMGKDWFPALFEYLTKKGYSFHGSLYTNEKILGYDKGIDGYYVVNGPSPRGFSRGHSVVYYKGKLAHDPYPGGSGLKELWSAYMIERI